MVFLLFIWLSILNHLGELFVGANYLVIGICKIVIRSHTITSLNLRSHWRWCNGQNLDDHPLGSRMLRVHTQKVQVFVRDFLENAVNLIREDH